MSAFRFISKANVALAAFEPSSSSVREFLRLAQGAQSSCSALSLKVKLLDEVNVNHDAEDKCRSAVKLELHDGKVLDFGTGAEPKQILKNVSEYAFENQIPQKK
mmetsp:Transcript_9535/g.16716  ORF Transcript_9535/g.16716 Transcript_9535/m.16716 type:complete len:104 (+) Transcript_9535:100-411(+)